MAKVTITLTDNERGGIGVEVEFSPRICDCGMPTKAHHMTAMAVELWERVCNLKWNWKESGLLTSDEIWKVLRTSICKGSEAQDGRA